MEKSGRKIVDTINSLLANEDKEGLTKFITEQPNWAYTYIENNNLEIKLLLCKVERVVLELGYRLSEELKK